MPVRRLALTLTLAVLATAAAGCGGSDSSTTSVPPETPDPLPKLADHWKPFRSDGQGLAIGVARGWKHGAPCLGNRGEHRREKANSKRHEHGKQRGQSKPKGGHGKQAKNGNRQERGGQKGTRGAGAEVVVLCSPNLLTTVSVTVDRSTEALDVPVNQFATRAFQSLSDERYGGSLEGGQPRKFGGVYEGVAVSGKGRIPGSGFKQKVKLIVLRRESLANFTVVIAANASASAAQQRQAERMVRTLRDEPVENSAGNSAPLP
jgi:hypothetical protein